MWIVAFPCFILVKRRARRLVVQLGPETDSSPMPPATKRFLSSLLLINAFVLLCHLCWTADAQQPFYSDDADVTEKGHFHLEFSNEYDLLQRSLFPNLRQNTADLELDYGLAKNLEVGVESPLITIFNAPEILPR